MKNYFKKLKISYWGIFVFLIIIILLILETCINPNSSLLNSLSLIATIFTPIIAYLIFTKWKRQDSYTRTLNLFEDLIKNLNELHTAIFLFKHKRFLIIEKEFLNKNPTTVELNEFLNIKLNNFIDQVHTIYPYLFRSIGLIHSLKIYVPDISEEFDSLVDDYHQILQKLPLFYKEYLEHTCIIIENNLDEKEYKDTLYICRKAQICIYHSFDNLSNNEPPIATSEHLNSLKNKRVKLIMNFKNKIHEL